MTKDADDALMLDYFSPDTNSYLNLYQKDVDPNAYTLLYRSTPTQAVPTVVDVIIKPKGLDRYYIVPRAPLQHGGYVFAKFAEPPRMFLIGGLEMKRSLEAGLCINNLRRISGAKDQFALDHNGSAPISLGDLDPNYISRPLKCPAGAEYALHGLGENPQCPTRGHTLPDAGKADDQRSTTGTEEHSFGHDGPLPPKVQANTGFHAEASEGEFASSGAERIGIANQTILEALVDGDGRSLSEVVFTDDGKRFVYSVHQREAVRGDDRKPPENEIIIRDTSSLTVLETFHWKVADEVDAIAWSPNSERLLCISGGSRAIALVDIPLKKVTSVPIEGIWSSYLLRAKWRSENGVMAFCEGGSSRWVMQFDLDTLKATDVTHEKDEYVTLERECFEPSSHHGVSRVVTFEKGRYQTDKHAAVENRDHSFIRLLSDANDVSVRSVAGCYAAPDLRTVVMCQQLNNGGPNAPTNALLVACRMGLRPPPALEFRVAFSSTRNLSQAERDDLDVCLQARRPLRGNVYAAVTNPLNNRIVGPNKECRKGEIVFGQVGDEFSSVRITEEVTPAAKGDIIADICSDQLPYGTLTKSGGMSFGLDRDAWFVLEPTNEIPKSGSLPSQAILTRASGANPGSRAACLNRQRDISFSIDQYAIDHNGATPPSISNMVPEYLRAIPSCPDGGAYTLDPDGGVVKCSISSHSGQNPQIEEARLPTGRIAVPAAVKPALTAEPQIAATVRPQVEENYVEEKARVSALQMKLVGQPWTASTKAQLRGVPKRVAVARLQEDVVNSAAKDAKIVFDNADVDSGTIRFHQPLRAGRKVDVSVAVSSLMTGSSDSSSVSITYSFPGGVGAKKDDIVKECARMIDVAGGLRH